MIWKAVNDIIWNNLQGEGSVLNSHSADVEMQDFGQPYGLQIAWGKKKKVICMGIKQPIQDSHYSILDGISCSAAVVKRHQPHQHHGINKFINQPVVPWARPRHTWGVWWCRHVSSSYKEFIRIFIWLTYFYVYIMWVHTSYTYKIATCTLFWQVPWSLKCCGDISVAGLFCLPFALAAFFQLKSQQSTAYVYN